MSTLYAGPGKVFINSIALQPEGENGPVDANVVEDTAEIAAGMFGRVGEQVRDKTGDITVKPFDSWGAIPTLFPTYLGVTSSVGTGALVIGTRPHAAAIGGSTGAKIWTPDGRLYNFLLAAVIGHPSLHLGNGVPMFGQAKIMAICDPAKALGAGSDLISGDAITETAASDPGGAFTLGDFVRGSWVGAFGAVTGFTAIESEDEWTIETNVKYSALKKQGRTMGYKLDSVAFMAKAKPYGPTHSQIIGRIAAHTAGQRLGAFDLVLTGPSSKTITLKNCEPRGAGFKFGGTSLGTGEVGFVTGMTVTTGAADPFLVFSA